MAHDLLLPEPIDEGPGMFIMEEDAHFLSIQINLINTFLYMVNYYIVVPSSDTVIQWNQNSAIQTSFKMAPKLVLKTSRVQ
jgi:hypothetical protein